MDKHNSGKNNSDSFENENVYEADNIITLDDETGNEIKFEFLDLVKYDGKEYVVLLPLDDLESGNVVIFRIEGQGDDESYVSLDSEEEALNVFELFKAKLIDSPDSDE